MVWWSSSLVSLPETCVFFLPPFIVSIWSEAWEIAPGWLESCGMAAGRTPNTRGPPQRQKDSRLGGWVFPRDARQPSLGTSQSGEVSDVVALFLMSFTCLSGNGGRTQGMQTQKDLAKFLLHENGNYLGSWVLPALVLGRLLHVPERVQPLHLLCLLRDIGASCTVCGKMTLAHQSCCIAIQRRSPDRGRCGRPAKACWLDCWRWPPSWCNHSDESGRSQLIGKELSSENGVGRPGRPREAEWPIPKVATGKEVGGWSKGHPWVCSVQMLLEGDLRGQGTLLQAILDCLLLTSRQSPRPFRPAWQRSPESPLSPLRHPGRDHFLLLSERPRPLPVPLGLCQPSLPFSAPDLGWPSSRTSDHIAACSLTPFVGFCCKQQSAASVTLARPCLPSPGRFSSLGSCSLKSCAGAAFLHLSFSET